MKTVHLIFHAHLDPIWLWPLTAGIDECLSTCRSACDRLDAHPDLRYSQGEAWVYQQVERIDPKLFARIRRHIDAGGWEITGGWWAQADCNAPSGFALAQQIELGKRYFASRFNQFPIVGFNPDSFGHTASLPGIMYAAGQRYYVMMRPMAHEKQLPARVFRWRGHPDGPEIITFRIAGSYMCPKPDQQDWMIRECLKDLPEDIDDTMCFLGVGDHGGGPTEALIAWLRANWNSFEGVQLKFSTMAEYFRTIQGKAAGLPLVTGELQHHAVGCYSVHRPTKTEVRRTEHLLYQAQLNLDPNACKEERQAVEQAWQTLCLHSFHDTMGGTCLPSAYQQVARQLGGAAAVAEDSLIYGLRRKMAALPPEANQRMVFFNASDQPFDGYIEVEPWVDWWQMWKPTHKVIDADGNEVHCQQMQSEAMCEFGPDGHPPHLLLRRRIAPQSMDILSIVRNGNPSPVQPQVAITPSGQLTSSAASSEALPPMSLDLIEDLSDTWSHDTDRYDSGPIASATWDANVTVTDTGPLMASFVRCGEIGASTLKAEWRAYADERHVELLLDVDWREQRKVLKLTVTLPSSVQQRLDGVSGGGLVRPNEGKEVPLRDWTLLEMGSTKLGIVCPDVFAADCSTGQLRLTLLRASFMAHHVPFSADPASPRMARAVVSDQGHNRFRFRFFIGSDLTEQLLESHALMMQRPPLFADLTEGMPSDDRIAP